MQCSAGDGGLSAPGIVLWGMVPSRHMLRWLKTVVVSDVEKAQVMRQAGVRETTAVDVSRSLRRHQNRAGFQSPG
jgi:hypothetical protein